MQDINIIKRILIKCAYIYIHAYVQVNFPRTELFYTTLSKILRIYTFLFIKYTRKHKALERHARDKARNSSPRLCKISSRQSVAIRNRWCVRVPLNL